MTSGYSVLFDDGACVIKDKKSWQIIVVEKDEWQDTIAGVSI